MKMTTYEVPTIYQGQEYGIGNPKEQNCSENEKQTLRVRVPGSKSITNRALLLATLAEGESCLKGVLFSDDSRHFLKCIQDLGFETTVDEENACITVKGHGGAVPLANAAQYVGSAGTAARFLTAYLGISHGTYYMDASAQMRKRPMAPLLDSLQELGCEITYPKEDAAADDTLPPHPSASGIGHFPFTLHGHGFCKNEITINIDHSSQFLSALLIAACLAEEDFSIHVEGTHGMAYIDMTCKMMEQFGVHTLHPAADLYQIPSGQGYLALDYQIEPDVSAACYFYAMAPLLHLPVLVENVHFDSLQGDVAFLDILTQMGCHAQDTPEGILVTPPAANTYHGVTVDMSACSDQAITLAAIAPFADCPTTITGIGHIRFQESDRIHAIVSELTKMGIRCEETSSSITIYPGSPAPSHVDTYEDHRMAMGFSLIGLRSPGIIINNPECCGKTFENYFDVLEQCIQTIHSF